MSTMPKRQSHLRSLRGGQGSPAGAGVVSRIAHVAHQQPPTPMTDPWWESLPRDFWAQRELFKLDRRDRYRVAATAAIDVGLRTAAASLVAATAIPLGFHPLNLREMLASRSVYAPLARSADPSKFFVTPERGVRVRRDPAWAPLFRPSDGTCEDLSFLSRFQPVNPALRSRFLRHRANLLAHGRYWSHADGPRPTVIVVHGFGADFYALNEWLFAFRWIYEKLGCDILLFTLPFHGLRQTRFSAFSGHGFFAGGISRINEAFALAVHDLRVFIDWLETERGVDKVGITGISLGGYTSALMAAVEPRLKFSIPNVPVVTIADLVFEWEPAGSLVRAAMAAMGIDIVEAREMLAVHTPLTYRPVLAPERLMIIGGVADRLAPPKHSRLLWEHWDRCALHWFPGSHILHLDRGTYLRQMAHFMRSIEFI